MQSISLASVMLLLAAGCASSAPVATQTPEPPTPPAWTKDLGSRTLEALIVRGGRWLPPDRLPRPPGGSGVAGHLAVGFLILLLALRWRVGAL